MMARPEVLLGGGFGEGNCCYGVEGFLCMYRESVEMRFNFCTVRIEGLLCVYGEKLEVRFNFRTVRN